MVNRVGTWVVAMALALCWPVAGIARAQGLTGTISGSVVDASGSVLPGASVNVKNAGTQVSRDSSATPPARSSPRISSPARTT